MTVVPSDASLRTHAESLWVALSAQLPGLSIEVLPTVNSTNTRLMQQAREGLVEPTVLVAETQTAGRGRMGKSWHTATHRALTFSLGLPLSPEDWSGLSLVVGLSLARSLHPELRLKWPNDLWWQQRKVGGILVETANIAQRPERYVVIGVGLNLDTPRPQAWPNDEAQTMAPQAPAGLCEVLGPEVAVTRGEVLSRVLPSLVADVRRFEREGFGPFAQAFAERDALAGLSVTLSDGQQGVACGLDAQGGLQVQTAQGMMAVTSSTVSVRPC
jgi:BirA family transcriptional regulator, biotin operon repressor / biotin---[acetyl-CoA-carboxylase] ligase